MPIWFSSLLKYKGFFNSYKQKHIQAEDWNVQENTANKTSTKSL